MRSLSAALDREYSTNLSSLHYKILLYYNSIRYILRIAMIHYSDSWLWFLFPTQIFRIEYKWRKNILEYQYLSVCVNSPLIRRPIYRKTIITQCTYMRATNAHSTPGYHNISISFCVLSQSEIVKQWRGRKSCDTPDRTRCDVIVQYICWLPIWHGTAISFFGISNEVWTENKIKKKNK